MLLISPVFALMVFAQRALVPAILTAVVVPYLFLPEAFDIPLPGLPDLDKPSIISIGLVLGYVFYGRQAAIAAGLPGTVTRNNLFRILTTTCLVTILAGAALTVLNNGEPLRYGPLFIPATRPWDIVSQISTLTFFLMPFVFARRYLATPDAHRKLLQVIVIWGLFYSLLMLVEIRLSPQLHNWVYGYYQHSFMQHIRNGYRPMVFLQHGLWVGFFTFTAVMAAAALWKSTGQAKWLWATGWMFFILLNSENFGAVSLGVLFLGALFFTLQRMQIWLAAAVAVSVLFYPALRQAQLVPLEQILSAAATVSEERAGSLAFRLNNEDQLLARAFEKPLTGWGGYSRDRIYDERGEEQAPSEGLWMLTLGRWGWIGYIGLFGVLTLPVIFLVFTRRRKDVPPETVVLALICAGNLIYLIPNATLTPVCMLIFGALAGFVQSDPVGRTASAESTTPKGRNPTQYTRFPQQASRR